MLQAKLNSDQRSRVFSESETRAVITEVVSYIPPDMALKVQLGSWWSSGQKWARNRASLSSDQRDVTLILMCPLSHNRDRSRFITITALTNQTDSASLRGIASHINFYFDKWRDKVPPDRIVDIPRGSAGGTDVWSDSTFDRSILENANAVQQLTSLSEKDNLMSAGYIEASGSTALHYNRDEWGREEWQWGNVTQAQCSVTVRDKGGGGSGWAGKTSFDIGRVDISEISSDALERCRKSLNPVRVEPGRYQVILEPQATATLIGLLMLNMERQYPERRAEGPFLLGHDQLISRYKSKLGLRVVDERINIYHDPSHPYFGTHVAPLHGRADFIKDGVLVGMMDDYRSHLNEVSDIYPNFLTTSYRMSGGQTLIDEMVASSKRALLVARLTQAELIDIDTMLVSGVTRDGLWLIEDGVVTKAVRNFKWTESPLFALNNIESIGVEEQVFFPNTSRHPLLGNDLSLSLNNVVVPPLKINDFSFTSTIDAV